MSSGVEECKGCQVELRGGEGCQVELRGSEGCQVELRGVKWS